MSFFDDFANASKSCQGGWEFAATIVGTATIVRMWTMKATTTTMATKTTRTVVVSVVSVVDFALS